MSGRCALRIGLGLALGIWLLIAASPAAFGVQGDDEGGLDELRMKVEQAIVGGDRLGVAELIAVPGSEAETVARYLDLERTLYRDARDLDAAIFVAEQGIAYCLTRAVGVEAENVPLARQLRGAASRLAFNLASATWPGWDEPGIAIRPSQRELGLASARLALRISGELNAGPGPLANGYWMLGAHEMAAGRPGAAAGSFGRAALMAASAGDRGTELVSEGFAALAGILAGEDAEAARQRLVEIRETIGREVEDPEFWTGQIDTAYRVFVETDAGRGEVRD